MYVAQCRRTERWTPPDVCTLCFIVREKEVFLIRKLRGLGAGRGPSDFKQELGK